MKLVPPGDKKEPKLNRIISMRFKNNLTIEIWADKDAGVASDVYIGVVNENCHWITANFFPTNIGTSKGDDLAGPITTDCLAELISSVKNCDR